MGISKSTQFTEKQNRKAELYKALGHPARIAIIEFLIEKDSCVCGDIVENLPLSQSTISQHLKELKNLGLIKGNIEGTSICYCIDKDNWSHMKTVISEFLNQDLSENGNCC